MVCELGTKAKNLSGKDYLLRSVKYLFLQFLFAYIPFLCVVVVSFFIIQGVPINMGIQ